ncbi:hypothetical protein RI367_003354 [Sorochytrium milnesiophthora]
MHTRLLSLAAGWSHAIALTRTRSHHKQQQQQQHLHLSGLNSAGQLGLPPDRLPVRSVAHSVPPDHACHVIAAGRQHSLALLSRHQASALWSCGSNRYAQRALPLSHQDPLPFIAPVPQALHHFAAGLDHSVFSTSSSIYTCGWNADGQCGQGSPSDAAEYRAVQAAFASPAVKLSSSADHTLALEPSGQLWSWGNSEYGQCMLGQVSDKVLPPTRVPVERFFPGEMVVDIAAGGTISYVLTDRFNLYACGYGIQGKDELSLTPRIISNRQPRLLITDIGASVHSAVVLAVDPRTGEQSIHVAGDPSAPGQASTLITGFTRLLTLSKDCQCFGAMCQHLDLEPASAEVSRIACGGDFVTVAVDIVPRA